MKLSDVAMVPFREVDERKYVFVDDVIFPAEGEFMLSELTAAEALNVYWSICSGNVETNATGYLLMFLLGVLQRASNSASKGCEAQSVRITFNQGTATKITINKD